MRSKSPLLSISGSGERAVQTSAPLLTTFFDENLEAATSITGDILAKACNWFIPCHDACRLHHLSIGTLLSLFIRNLENMSQVTGAFKPPLFFLSALLYDDLWISCWYYNRMLNSPFIRAAQVLGK